MTPTQITSTLDTLPRPVCAYLYHPSTFHHQATALRAALPDNACLYYAMKANSHPAILKQAIRDCHGIECASEGEIERALTAGASRLLFGGPAKTDSALTTAITSPADLVINVESPHELRRVNHIARSYGKTIDIALRVNRTTTTPHGSHRMTGTPTPFGIDEQDLDTTVRLATELDGLRLTGLHFHAVSNNLDATAHVAHAQDCLHFALETAQRHDLTWETINIGGGIGADPAGHGEFDLTEFAAGMRHWPQNTTLVCEPGRYLVAEAGWYTCEIIDIKHNLGRDFVVVRGGTHHFRLPAAWGYDHPAAVHPVEEWPYPWQRTELRATRVDVVGELCTPRDVLCRDLPIDHVRVGDLLVFARTGAYGWEVAHHDFLNHPYPYVVVV